MISRTILALLSCAFLGVVSSFQTSTRNCDGCLGSRACSPSKLSLTDKEGTNLNGEFVTDGSGNPGIWIKEVVNGRVVQRVCPPSGKLTDLLRPATYIVEDEDALEQCRLENPDNGPALPNELII